MMSSHPHATMSHGHAWAAPEHVASWPAADSSSQVIGWIVGVASDVKPAEEENCSAREQQQQEQQESKIPHCTWIPVAKAQLVATTSLVCNESVQQNLQVQWADQPTAMELTHVPLQNWMKQQQQHRQQQQHWQLQLQLQQQLDACTGCSSQVRSSQWSFNQHCEATRSLGALQDSCQDEASSASSNSSRIDLLIESLNADVEAKNRALASLRGSVVSHAFTAQGCRVVQLAFQVADRRVAAELLAELRGHVQSATRSPHANYVLQTAIGVVPPAACGFIVQEIRGFAVAVARHRLGCHVLCRLLEHLADSLDCVELIEEVMAEAGCLSRHEFGHHVMESVLEHGQASHRGCLYQLIISDLAKLAGCSSSSYVVEKALTHGSSEEQQSIGTSLLALGLDGMVALALTQSGSSVTRTLLGTRADAARTAAEQLCHAEARLKRNPHGKRVLSAVRRKGGMDFCGNASTKV